MGKQQRQLSGVQRADTPVAIETLLVGRWEQRSPGTKGVSQVTELEVMVIFLDQSQTKTEQWSSCRWVWEQGYAHNPASQKAPEVPNWQNYEYGTEALGCEGGTTVASTCTNSGRTHFRLNTFHWFHQEVNTELASQECHPKKVPVALGPSCQQVLARRRKRKQILCLQSGTGTTDSPVIQYKDTADIFLILNCE